MAAREQIFATLARRLRQDAHDPERERLEADLQHPTRNLIPRRANVSGDDCVQLFEEMARASLASVERITALESLPRHVASYLDVCQLPRELVIAPDRRLALDWDGAGVNVHSRLVRDGDVAALAPAFCGIAETGTLMFLSGSEHASASSFLPDHHLVVVRQRDVVGSYEQAWERLRSRGEGMPRAVNWVTGPSRSADIELTMLMGAHGPLALHVVIVTEDG